jgi:hypothetical protein
MSKPAVAHIKITKVTPKGGFNADSPEEIDTVFLEQFFDKNGNKVKEIIFSQEGEEEQTTVLEYSPEHKPSLEKHFFHLDEIEEQTAFKYDNGLLVQKIKTYSYGSIENTYYTYNEHRLPLSIIVADDDGGEEESELFEYEGKNLIHYSKQNALIGKEKEIWIKYDEKNRPIEEKKWSHLTGKTTTSYFDYTKHEHEPDIKIMNDKGAVVEAHIHTFNDRNQVVTHEVQVSDNGLKKYITAYDYNEQGSVTFIETLNHKDELQRRVISTFNEHGLLLAEDKSEYAIELGTVATFTFNYEYTFHQ